MSKKVKMRQDGWSTDEDLILVEIVLRNIRTGKKMKDAWNEAESTLEKRSRSACQFRWCTELAKRYDASVEQAKLQRMAYKEILPTTEGSPKKALPEHGPINVVSDAMEKALHEKKEKRVGKVHMANTPTGTEEKEEQNPFRRIRRFVAKMEKEYSGINVENKELQQTIASLEQEVALLQTSLDQANKRLVELEQEVEKSHEQLTSYAEIKELISQFNQIESV